MKKRKKIILIVVILATLTVILSISNGIVFQKSDINSSSFAYIDLENMQNNTQFVDLMKENLKLIFGGNLAGFYRADQIDPALGITRY